MPNDKEFELDDLESFSFDDLSLDEAPEPASDDAPGGQDPFGVWVKSAPEDVADEILAENAAEDSSGLPEDDFLSSDELAHLDESFDFVTVSEEPLEGETPLEDEIAFLDTPEAVEAEKTSTVQAPASFDEVSLDDFVSFDDVSLDEGPSVVEEALAEAEGTPEDDLNEEFLDIDIDIEDDIGDEELEIIEGAAPRVVEEKRVENFASQDVDLSEFGDFEEVAAGPLAEAEDLPEVMDLPDLPPMDDLEPLEEPVLAQDEGFFEETVLDDSLPPLVEEENVSLDLEPDDQTDLDHIMALEEDLTAGIRTSEEPAPVSDANDRAAAILGKIEQELSSIKQEISALKKEVTHLRAPAQAPLAAEPAPEPEPQPEAASKSHGFFDEEDDETIALTGDELDNLLSTAEISEGEEQGLTLDEDLIGMDAEGNLVEAAEATEAPEALHVTDEEFLAGTALDLNEPDPLAEETELGIPESIELEEGLPLSLEEGQTEDLLASASDEEEFEVGPLPEGLLGSPEPLEIPFDDDINLEEEQAAALPEETLDGLPDLEDFDDLPAPAESEGWSPSSLPSLEEDSLTLDLAEEEPEPVPAPAPLVPAPVPSVPAGGSLSPNLKGELKAVLQYMDKLLASLPDDKIQEFAESEHFEVYKRLFEELGLIE